MIHGYEALAFMIIYNVAMDNTRVISMLRWFRPLKLEPGFGCGWRWPESESGSYRKKLDTDQTEIKKNWIQVQPIKINIFKLYSLSNEFGQ